MCEYMLHIAGITYRPNTRDGRVRFLFVPSLFVNNPSCSFYPVVQKNLNWFVFRLISYFPPFAFVLQTNDCSIKTFVFFQIFVRKIICIVQISKVRCTKIVRLIKNKLVQKNRLFNRKSIIFSSSFERTSFKWKVTYT